MIHNLISTRRSRVRKTLMMSCASAALATAALMPQKAQGQAFQGTPTTTAGTVTYDRGTPGSETITVGTNNASIAWNPTVQSQGGTINFLPSGNTATFTSTPGLTDYTVLNRILPQGGEAISLNGHVVSTLQGTSATGGRVWFYSPGGIVIGATAVFDVGSLLLTTNDLVGFEGNVAGFSGSPGSTSRIQVQNGAQINALQSGSYVAMIAPRIEQGGKVRVNGSAAYVAAEQATLTVNQGLFDIQVDVGTTDSNGVVHTGETSGPANTAATDNHNIYMVAVPKNQALTMLLGGKVGFDDAGSASVENGQIILSAGYNVSDANFDNDFMGGAISTTLADIQINGGNFTSSVRAAATSDIEAFGGGGTLAFAHDVSLQALQSATLFADAGETITIGGNAMIGANDVRNFTTENGEVGIDALAGTASILAAAGGSIQIAGDANVTADGTGAANSALLTAGISEGGFASIESTGGTVSIGGNARVSASGYGANSTPNGTDGSESYGGFAEIGAFDGGSIHVGGTLELLAEATGRVSAVATGGAGGYAYGGSAGLLAESNGSIDIGGEALVSSFALGGILTTSPDGQGGLGDGGTTYLEASSGGSVHFGGGATLTSSGFGGEATAEGGDGNGGFTDVLIAGGSVSSTGALYAYADGVGGIGQSGGDGFGGSSRLDVTSILETGNIGSLTVTGDLRVQGAGEGGAGANNETGAGGNGGDGFSGSALFYVDQGTVDTPIQLANVFVTNNGSGGAGGNGLTGGNGGGGYGYGYFDGGEGGYFGDARFDLFSGAVTTAEMQVFSTARGGNGGSGSAGVGGNGGDAYGGFSTLSVDGNLTSTLVSSYDRALAGNGGSGTTQGNGGYAEGGDASAEIGETGQFTGNIDVFTAAFGGSGNVGGNALGGISVLDLEGIVTAGAIRINADGTGGAGSTGGDGTGGSANLYAFNGTHSLSVSGATLITAIGFGGDGLANAQGTGGSGGDGLGGYASIYAFGTSETADEGPQLSFGSVDVNAKGQGGLGGSGATGGAGGYGEGGYASLDLADATMTAGNMQVFARGIGGDGGAGSNGGGGAGGGALGGEVWLYVDSDSSLTGSTYLASTNGLGGAGGTGTAGVGVGGDAQSGYNSASIDGAATFGGTAETNNGFVVTSFANGGNGATGGSADAGSSNIYVGGSLTVGGQVQASAQAIGGEGGGIGGSAYAGNASIDVYGNLAAGQLFIGNNAIGGSGTSTGGEAWAGFGSLFVEGTMNITGTANIEANATGGNSSNGFGGYAEGGSIDIEAVNGGRLTGGNLTVTANATGGNGLTAGGAAGGDIDITADSWDAETLTSISLDQVSLTANGTAGVGGADSETFGVAGIVTLMATGGSIGADTLAINAHGTDFGGIVDIESVTDSNGQKGSMAFGTLDVSTSGGGFGGAILVATLDGSTVDLGDAELKTSGGAGTIFLSAGTCFECGGGEDGLDMAPHAPALPAGGGIGATDLTVTTDGNILVALSGGADIAVTNTLEMDAGQLIQLTDDGTGGAIRAHKIDLSALGILAQADLVADIILLDSASDMSIGNLSATDAITLTSGGNLTTGNLTAANALTLDSSGNVSAGDLSAQTVNVTADGGTSVGNVQAGTSATFTAGGLASFLGVVSSPTITVTSGDLDMVDGASLGVAGVTNLLTLNAVSNGQPILIGADNAPDGQYNLGSDGDLIAKEVVFNADGDVHIFGIEIEGSATSGGGVTHVTLNSEGTVLVNGVIDYTGAGADDSLSIKASDRIEVNTDTGGIQMTDNSGNLAGTLNLTANDVWVATGDVLAQLEEDPNFSGRDEALATNPGTPNQDGFLRAGKINAVVGETFLVQNSGTAELFGGVDTGDGGLSIETVGSEPVTVVAFGRQTTSDGSVITNQDFLDSVELTGEGGFTDESVVNGCSLGGSCGGQTEEPTPGIDMASILGPLDETTSPEDQDKQKDEEEGEESDDGSSVDPSLRLINTTPINLDQQIDEPVTSGGDVVIGGPQ